MTNEEKLKEVISYWLEKARELKLRSSGEI